LNQLGCFTKELVFEMDDPSEKLVEEKKSLNFELLLCDIIGTAHVLANMKSKSLRFYGAGEIAAAAGQRYNSSRLKQANDITKKGLFEEAKKNIGGIADAELSELYAQAVRHILYSSLTYEEYLRIYEKWVRWMDNVVPDNDSGDKRVKENQSISKTGNGGKMDTRDASRATRKSVPYQRRRQRMAE